MPELMAASVWMTSKMMVSSAVCRGRPRPETTPVVRVRSRPKGLPMAMARCPIRRSALLPSSTGMRLLPARSTRRTARSLGGSTPTRVASTSLPSPRTTLMRSALAMTWWLVTMWPWSSQRKPLPVPARGMGPKKKSIVVTWLVMWTTAGLTRS